MYWNMDNEPEIWSSTHDDVIKSPITAEDFVQRYIAVAKKARAAYPDIKLLGPAPANEWQWYNWENNSISYNGKNYPWLEYFIKRIADEQKASGMRLLDVVDLHFYPGASNADHIVQLHRVFFDKEYIWPEANGVKRIHGGWDPSQNKEYIFTRINDWLDTYMGNDHHVTLGMTEVGINGNNPNVTAVWYATTLGEFMKQGVEVFTPWSWKAGMWETLHLFSRFSLSEYIPTETNDETKCTVYTTANKKKDSICIHVVNKTNTTISVSIPFSFFTDRTQAIRYTLKNLPNQETFYSTTQNALEKETLSIQDKKINISLPPYGISAILLNQNQSTPTVDQSLKEIDIFPNPIHTLINVKSPHTIMKSIEMIDLMGRVKMKQFFNRTGLMQIQNTVPSGIYWMRIKSPENRSSIHKVIVK
jgi:O-glycosyl hydrolase